MNKRIAIDFAGRCLKNASTQTFREPKHIDSAMYAGLCSLYRIILVMNRRRWTRKIENAIDFHVQRQTNIMTQELKARMGEEMRDVIFATREQVVHAQYVVSVID
jgi:hypothetical protein